MRYISEVDYKKQMSELLILLKKTVDPSEKKKIEDEIEHLRKLRFDSSMEEKMYAMQGRQR